jgi:hypothetical protein
VPIGPGPDDGVDPGDGMGAGAVHGIVQPAHNATAITSGKLSRFMDAPCRSHFTATYFSRLRREQLLNECLGYCDDCPVAGIPFRTSSAAACSSRSNGNGPCATMKS